MSVKSVWGPKSRVQGLGLRVWVECLVFRVLGFSGKCLGLRVQGPGLMVESLGLGARVEASVFSVKSLDLRVEGPRSRVQGLWFRVWAWGLAFRV